MRVSHFFGCKNWPNRSTNAMDPAEQLRSVSVGRDAPQLLGGVHERFGGSSAPICPAFSRGALRRHRGARMRQSVKRCGATGREKSARGRFLSLPSVLHDASSLQRPGWKSRCTARIRPKSTPQIPHGHPLPTVLALLKKKRTHRTTRRRFLLHESPASKI